VPAYAEGTRLAPEALQCGDRWYLYKNLCDAATRPSAPTARTCASLWGARSLRACELQR